MKFSGFRILKSLKIAFLQIFRIQDPESSGSGDPAGKSQEGRQLVSKDTRAPSQPEIQGHPVQAATVAPTCIVSDAISNTS